MADNKLKLYCLVEGESASISFPVKIKSTQSVGDLKKKIKDKKPNDLRDVDADGLVIWCVFIPNEMKGAAITIKALGDKTELNDPQELLSTLFPKDPIPNTYVVIQRLTQELYLSANKKIRIAQGWKQYMASDGKVVDLPSSWIDILASTDFAPNPRTAFDHLKNDLKAGETIIMPSMGQRPKDFGLYGQPSTFFITEQMLELWEDMRGDMEHTYRRVLSGPMGVGKSYLSYFLAAKAYAEGWLVLYVSDAGILDTANEDGPALEIVERFLALNKDILTGAELEMLVNDYDGTRNIVRIALSIIFRNLLMSRGRKTLLLVDEHGNLFEKEPYVPDKFKSLVPLSSFHWWGEDAKGSRVIFTDTAHAKYEMKILDGSYRSASVVFVGPLSRNVFSKMVDMHPHLLALDIKREVTDIANCVPRELDHLATGLKSRQRPITVKDLEQWRKCRTDYFFSTAQTYFNRCTPKRKEEFLETLQDTFLGSTSAVNFARGFMDLGLVYQSKNVGQIGTQYHILCRPAQSALLKLFRTHTSLPGYQETN